MLLWSEESTDPPFNAIWKASDDPKHTANYVKAYLDTKKKHSVEHFLSIPLSIEEVYNVLREKPKELFVKTTWRT